MSAAEIIEATGLPLARAVAAAMRLFGRGAVESDEQRGYRATRPA